jgi:hypothetical protein
MSGVPFIVAMLTTHLAYLLVATAAALFLRAVRKLVERMAAEVETHDPTMMRGEQ